MNRIRKDEFLAGISIPIEKIYEHDVDRWFEFTSEHGSKKHNELVGEIRVRLRFENNGNMKIPVVLHIPDVVKNILAENLRKRRLEISNRNSLHTEGGVPDYQIESEFELNNVIGEGSYAKVWSGLRKDDSLKVAIKVLRKDQAIDQDELDMFHHELKILSDLERCDQIVGIIKLAESEDSLYVIMDLIEGGELFDFLNDSENGYLEEYTAASLARDILLGVKFLHDQNIVHRDIKLENVLMNPNFQNCYITDFGTATHINEDEPLTELIGTELYMAPELFQEMPYGKKVDTWATGVVLYIMLTGVLPYGDEDPCTSVISQDYELFPDEYKDYISEEGYELVLKLMEPNPDERLSCKKALKHVWFDF
eukprot:TRINITY_DN10300_c0_g1_i1.p1 TRINITY_DN10300_c0_g1~~TRINITY_DN10300_c0_g1_i1.p1  ORF type:complete len:367 (-),score=98.88 TRINITY_DN10300_c0_g1_i1:34-1134(-)